MTSHPSLPGLTLVVGATGKTGRRVADRLTALDAPVRAGSRSAEPPFDWTDAASWDAALTGVDAAYVAFQPDLAVPGAADTIGAFTERAAAHGVRRLVLLSGRGEPEAQECERRARAAFPALTVVRASWFAQNFSESFFTSGVVAGEVVAPVGDVREPFVDADDIADVAVAALTEPGHDGRTYEVTGPRALTFAEAVAEIAAATRRPVHLVPVPVDAYVTALAEQGVPADVTALLRYRFTDVLDGRNADVAHGVREALGRPPRDFAEYARRATADGAWEHAACA